VPRYGYAANAERPATRLPELNAVAKNIFAYITSHGVGRALRHRYYAWMEIVGWFSSSGLWFHRTAVGWLTFELTDSAVWVGMMVTAEAIPAVLLAPIAGVFADRYDRLFIARLTQSGMMLIAAALSIVTFLDQINVYVLFFTMVLNGVVSAFWQPVRMSLVAGLVPREDLSQAIGFHSVMFNLARFAGPALAGITIKLWGAGPAFAFNAISYAAFLVVFFYIRILYPDRPANRDVKFFSSFKEGLAYAFGHASLRPLLFFVLVFSFFGRAWTELFPAINAVMFGLGANDRAEALGYMLSGLGVGAVIGSLWMGTRARPENLVKLMAGGVIAAALALLGFANATVPAAGIALSIVLGFGVNSVGTGGQMIVQTAVRGDMRGRVLGIWGMTIRAAPAFGALTLGALTSLFGFPGVFFISATVCIVWGARTLAHRRAMTASMHTPN